MSKCILWLATAVVLAACASPSSSSSIPKAGVPFIKSASGSTPIAHVVLIVQENRTFNNLFATFPGATGATVGQERVGKQTQSIGLKETRLGGKRNLNHNYMGYLTAYDKGKMDGFDDVKFIRNGRPEGASPYVYVNPNDIAPYWTMAEQYGLANAMFTTQGSASFPAHQDLIRGGTEIDATASMIDNLPYTGQAWGCDSAPGSKTSLITTKLKYERNAGPFPCSSGFPSSGTGYETLRDLLDAQSLSWKYYTPKIGDSGGIWDAFDVIAPVRNGPEWSTDVSSPSTNIFSDITNGELATMSWVVPDATNSDHPGSGGDKGPSWVASIVNAIGQSQYWNSTAIIVVWDDWGGFYDPVKPPPHDNQGGPGFRVPMILISPYAREAVPSQPGYISNTVYEFGSIVRFVEDTYELGRLGTTDETTTSIADMLDFAQSPRPFQPIGSKYSRSFFLHQKPSREPVDTQ
jgi:phospholipase C